MLLNLVNFLTDLSLPVWNLSGSEYILSDCYLCAVLLCTLLDPKYLPALFPLVLYSLLLWCDCGVLRPLFDPVCDPSVDQFLHSEGSGSGENDSDFLLQPYHHHGKYSPSFFLQTASSICICLTL